MLFGSKNKKKIKELEKTLQEQESKSFDQRHTIAVLERDIDSVNEEIASINEEKENLEDELARLKSEREAVEEYISTYGDNANSAIMLRMAIAMENMAETHIACENVLHAIVNKLNDFETNVWTSVNNVSSAIDTLDTNLWDSLKSHRE